VAAPTLAVNDIVQMRVCVTNGAQTAYNLWHYKVTAIAGASLAIDLVTAGFSTQTHNLYKALFAGTSRFRGVGGKRLTPTPTLEYPVTGQAGFGTLLGDDLPSGTAGVVTKRSLTPGRAGRGRAFLPFPPESQNDPTGVPSVAYQTAVDNLCAVTLTNVAVVIGADAVTLSPIILKRTNPAASLLVDSRVVRSIWSNLHSRGPYGKANAPPF